MIQVYLCCEGTTDFEPICIYIRKAVISSEIMFVRKTRNDLRRETTVLTGRCGIHKHVTDIDRLAMIAKKDKCMHLAYHQDADGDYTGVYESIVKKFTEYKSVYSCIAVVPKEMIESWLLADEQAYMAVFGGVPENFPREPEEMWGYKGDPDSNYPKNVMDRILKQYDKTANRGIFAEIAEHSNISTLQTRCPQSFAQFVSDLQGFVTVK